MNVKLLGIDIAKTIFQMHGLDKTGKTVLRNKVRRSELMKFVAQLPQCTIVMEACGGANYWGREFSKLGHEVKLIAAQFVKPFVKGNKNDRNDAQAIAEAASRPSMNFVPIKGVEQQDIQNIHTVRERLIKQRTALSNQIRGILLEYGVCMAKGYPTLRKRLPEIIDDTKNGLTNSTRELFSMLYIELIDLDEKVSVYDKKLQTIFKENEGCQRISKIAGVGPIVATAILTQLSDPAYFKNGRHFAAYLGLVPKQHSSGGKERLLGISKRGNKYLRTLLIHGARSALIRIDKKSGKQSEWLKQLIARVGINRATVALANKNARVIWAMFARNEAYRYAA
jgi:transposase